MSDWGKAHTNNTIGYGQGSDNSTNGWGAVYAVTYNGETDLSDANA